MSLTFNLGHLNDLNGDVKETLKLSIFAVQKAAAPKNGVELRQGSNGTIRSSLAMSPDVTACNNLTILVLAQLSPSFVVFAFNLSRLCSL